MRTIQQYFNETEPKNRVHIFLRGNLIEKTTGNTLIIDNYQQLETIYISDIPNLTKLTIKNCEKVESLKLYLDKEIEVILLGEFPKLKNIKSISTQQQPIIIKNNKDCSCGGTRLIFECILILLNIMLLGYIWYAERKKRDKK